MLRIVDPQAQGTAPAGTLVLGKNSIFGFDLIPVKKHLFVIRMSYLETLTKLLTQIIQRLAYLFICHLVWCVADPKVQQDAKSKCRKPGVEKTLDEPGHPIGSLFDAIETPAADSLRYV